jgi:hypothetical protein
MPSVTLSPFRVLDDAEEQTGVVCGDWELNGRSGDTGVLSGWDYSIDIVARREVRLTCEVVRGATGLAPNSIVRVSVLWSTGAGFESRECGFYREIRLDQEDGRLDVEVRIPGASLAGAVVLTTVVSLVRRGAKSRHGAAGEAGSILWQDEHAVSVEGIGPRMPVAILDLEPEGAAWTVRTTDDWLTAHPSVGVHVLLNRRRHDVVKAFRANPPGESDTLIRSALFFDVGRQLIERALEDEEFDEDAPFPPQTCGRAIRSRIRTVFQRTIEEVRTLKAMEPEEFNAVLQSGHSLFKTSR